MKNDNKPDFLSTEQLLDIQRLVGRALLKMPKTQATKILATDASQKAFIREITKHCKNQQVILHNPHVLIAIPLLIDFYKKLFGLDMSVISEMEFPTHEKFTAYMAVETSLDEDQIMSGIEGYFKINLSKYKSPVAQNINRVEENRIQQRPSGVYVFAHFGSDSSDPEHKGKSYEDAVSQQMIFARAKEYLLMTGFHLFTKGYLMDKSGWTRTASLWSNGDLVRGYADGGGSFLCMDSGPRDFRHSGSGPRQLFLLS